MTINFAMTPMLLGPGFGLRAVFPLSAQTQDLLQDDTILDSFGQAEPGSGDLGGIYQRWDETRPTGQYGYEGIAPTQNVARPPGEWQTFDITFRTPRFDDAGRKIRHATFDEILLNGVLVQANVQVTGPTRSAPLAGEQATGPIAIQGDHGLIALRHYRVTPLN
jgi:hypothetical protein